METISKEDYLKAKKIITEYYKQLESKSNCTCYIMHRTKDNLMFVTTDKEYADELYKSGEFVMRESRLVNPY
jgi:peptide subunit release factor 1 (eRF1)